LILTAYFVCLGLALCLALFRSGRFAAVLLASWAVIFALERGGLGVIMPYLDGLTFYALLLLTLGSPNRRYIVCTQLAALKLLLHMVFNGVAYATGGWWTELGQALALAYMWSLNADFLAMAVSLIWGMNVRSVVGMFLAGYRSLFGVPARFHRPSRASLEEERT